LCHRDHQRLVRTLTSAVAESMMTSILLNDVRCCVCAQEVDTENY